MAASAQGVDKAFLLGNRAVWPGPQLQLIGTVVDQVTGPARPRLLDGLAQQICRLRDGYIKVVIGTVNKGFVGMTGFAKVRRRKIRFS